MVENTVEKEQVQEQPLDETMQQQAMEEAERRKRVEACTAEINETLSKYNCELDAAVLLRAGMVMPSVKVIPAELSPRNQAPQQ